MFIIAVYHTYMLKNGMKNSRTYGDKGFVKRSDGISNVGVYFI